MPFSPFFCRILVDKVAIKYGFVRHVTKYSDMLSNPQQYSSARPLVHTASVTTNYSKKSGKNLWQRLSSKSASQEKM
jgi:hypothetical protein